MGTAKRRSRADLFAQIERISKEEILEILRDQWISFHVVITQDRINSARARVLRRKADAEFKRWEEFNQVACPGDPGDPLALARYYQRLAEKEEHFQRYMRLSNKADRLEFGRDILKGGQGATK